MLKTNVCLFCKNSKVISGEPIATKHWLLTLDILFKGLKICKLLRGEPTIKEKMIERGP